MNEPVTAVETTTELSERQVTMSNRLARSAQGANLYEKRLIALGLVHTDSYSLKDAALRRNGWVMRVNARQYAEEFGVSASSAYQQMKEASEALWKREIRFEIAGARGPVSRKYRWVTRADYAEGDAYVELEFHRDVAPHLLGLRSQFTTYKLRHVANLDTVYAWRLFECLRSWSNTGRWQVTIAEFWETMEVPEAYKKDFKALRVRVIEPSVASIKAKAGMDIEWRPIRYGGRRVSELEFTFLASAPARFIRT